ncbi:MAG: NADP-dependent glyceraldehyde-3-phosphate dehydrogenase [Bacteroidota bacterium]
MSTEEDIFDIFPAKEDIPAEYFLDGIINQDLFLINGELRKWQGDQQEVYSPVLLKNNGTNNSVLIGRYPLMDKNTALQALNAAEESFDHGRGQWATMKIEDRISYLIDFLNRFQKKKDELVKLLMWEIGKPEEESIKEFDRTVRNISDTIKELKVLDRDSSKFNIEENIVAQIRRTPLGVVLCMGPFNFPLNETFATLIPALMMGNSIVFKPPKHGVLLHEPLLELFKDCFPKGVINTIYGRGEDVVIPILKSGKVNVLAFIGSSKVANVLRSYHPKPNRLNEVYGLEAKNPGIILKDADLESSVDECFAGALTFNGQRCTALKILFVHSSLADRFLERLSKKMDEIRVGMPWEKNVLITPLPEEAKVDYLADLVEDAQKHGASIINKNGGKMNETLFYPAALYPVNDKMKIYHEEQFGPVIPIIPFDSVEEPLQYIRNSNYGQQVSVFGKNPDTIASLIDPLVNQTARVNINSLCQRGPDTLPFTGRKDSAKATLSVFDALRVFSIRSVVAGKNSESNKELISDIAKEGNSNFLFSDSIL